MLKKYWWWQLRYFHTYLQVKCTQFCSSKWLIFIKFVYIYFPIKNSFAVYLLLYKSKDIRNKSKAYIGSFLLCESTLGLIMFIILKNMPLFQNDLLFVIANSLLILSLISYMGMNIFNHLLLIYWEIYKVSWKCNHLNDETTEISIVSMK